MINKSFSLHYFSTDHLTFFSIIFLKPESLWSKKNPVPLKFRKLEEQRSPPEKEAGELQLS